MQEQSREKMKQLIEAKRHQKGDEHHGKPYRKMGTIHGKHDNQKQAGPKNKV